MSLDFISRIALNLHNTSKLSLVVGFYSVQTSAFFNKNVSKLAHVVVAGRGRTGLIFSKHAYYSHGVLFNSLDLQSVVW